MFTGFRAVSVGVRVVISLLVVSTRVVSGSTGVREVLTGFMVVIFFPTVSLGVRVVPRGVGVVCVGMFPPVVPTRVRVLSMGVRVGFSGGTGSWSFKFFFFNSLSPPSLFERWYCL